LASDIEPCVAEIRYPRRVVRSVAVLVFIGGTAAAGVYVGTRPTVIDGRVMAETMLEQVRAKGVRAVDCDRSIPVSQAGAVFACTLAGDDGSTARFEYTMDRAGALTSRLLGSTPPVRKPRAPGADPWGE